MATQEMNWEEKIINTLEERLKEKDLKIKHLESKLDSKIGIIDSLPGSSEKWVKYLLQFNKMEGSELTTNSLKLTPHQACFCYEGLKKVCFDEKVSKWKLHFAKNFIIQNQVRPAAFIVFFKAVVDQHFNNSINQKGLKSSQKFYTTLQNSVRFQETNFRLKKLELKNKEDIVNFLIKMKELNEFLEINNSQMVTVINKLFNTGLSESTIRRYYFDI
ncbi:hypothetical protein [uncultured Christiangramia sp.]|uniref:hypothetical protein n=1 Tax=uncultured Christiangramia sp. TaxID=503836 RepID=UPI0026188083|nr:hypothetical protein [uncultured Christiangramia sp.]